MPPSKRSSPWLFLAQKDERWLGYLYVYQAVNVQGNIQVSLDLKIYRLSKGAGCQYPLYSDWRCIGLNLRHWAIRIDTYQYHFAKIIRNFSKNIERSSILTTKIPTSHKYLLEGPVYVVLTTVMPDGQPQSTPVWCNLDGNTILINTMRQFRKAKNIQVNPKVSLLAYQLKEPIRNIEVRGRVVEITEDGALEHLNELNMLYTGLPNFFGDSVDADLKNKFTPVKVRIEPIRVRVEE